MAGIADVQPKSIGQVSLPVMAPVVLPGPAGSGVSETLPEAFQKYSQMFNTIKDKPLIDIQRENAMQQAQLQQQNAPGAAAAQAAQNQFLASQANQQQANITGKDAEDAYYRYNAVPHLGNDGLPDHHFIREAGMNYIRAEWQYARAQKGLTPLAPFPVQQNGQTVNVYKNGFYEDAFDPKVRAKYQKDMDDSVHVLFGKPMVDSTTPGDLSVADKNNPPASTDIPAYNPPPSDVSGTVSPSASVSSTPIPPDAITPAMDLPVSNQPVLPPQVAPVMARVAQTTGQRPPSDLFDPQARVAEYLGQQPNVAPAALPVGMPYSPPDQGESQPLPFTPGRPPTTTVTTDNQGKPILTIEHGTPPATQSGLPMVDTPLGAGVPTGIYAANPLTESIQKQKEANPGWQTWYHSIGESNEIKAMLSDPALQKPTGDMNAFDLRLKKAMTSMLNPQTAGREGSAMAEMELKQPYLQKYGTDIGQFLLGTGSLTTESRKALLSAASKIVATREQTGRGAVTSAIAQYNRAGMWPGKKDDFTPEELALAQGGTNAVGGHQTPIGPVRTLKSGRQVQL